MSRMDYFRRRFRRTLPEIPAPMSKATGPGSGSGCADPPEDALTNRNAPEKAGTVIVIWVTPVRVLEALPKAET